MAKKVNKQNTINANFKLEKFILPIILFSISLVVKFVFVSNKNNNNNVKIGETGSGSNLSISQRNLQENNTDVWQIVFLAFLILSILSLGYVIYKTRGSVK